MAMPEPRYIMIGGFLGAGKTTAILRVAEQLTAGGLRVGLITNDQSYGLVDTAMLGSHGFPVEEITGGCFCCKFNSLIAAAERLKEEARPDVFLAEPVGSCTDLKATVDYPLRRMYGEDYSVAPLSVLVDPLRALRILGLEEGRNFSPRVTYIYRKQLEEADFILINKIDLVSPERLQILRDELEKQFPAAAVLSISAREGEGVADWISALGSTGARTGSAMELDYDTYAEGEALLGWLNATLDLQAEDEFDGNRFLLDLASDIAARLENAGAEIAHLKLTLSPGQNGSDIGVANLVRSGPAPELSHSLYEPLADGRLILNLRAEAAPELLHQAVQASIAALDGAGPCRIEVEHLEHFRPGRPTPTHRLAAA